ncbi:pyridoxal-dependent decarboxylase [Streptomyces sp. TYQ1024]|nr:pyridoxal-dependent decarboxylase [Streptomyces sp. TYQ1024]
MARDVCGLPPGGSGVLTTGGSMANLSALVTARHDRLGEGIGRGTLYVGEQAHYSVAKAARVAGIPRRNVRVIPVDGDLRMDLDAAAELIRADRAAGLRPFLLVATAGTTDTGAIDPLTGAGALAAREDLWFHVDAAYGGFFRLVKAYFGLYRWDHRRREAVTGQVMERLGMDAAWRNTVRTHGSGSVSGSGGRELEFFALDLSGAPHGPSQGLLPPSRGGPGYGQRLRLDGTGPRSAPRGEGVPRARRSGPEGRG